MSACRVYCSRLRGFIAVEAPSPGAALDTEAALTIAQCRARVVPAVSSVQLDDRPCEGERLYPVRERVAS